jgi:hypothetical protein
VVARRQLLVLHDRLVIGAAEVVHGGLRPDDGGVEGVQDLKVELRRDGRGAGGGKRAKSVPASRSRVSWPNRNSHWVIHVASTLNTRTYAARDQPR